MAGAITQNPVGIGYKTVEAAVKALKGEKPDFKTDVDQIIATAENIDDVVAKNPYVYAEFKDKVANL